MRLCSCGYFCAATASNFAQPPPTSPPISTATTSSPRSCHAKTSTLITSSGGVDANKSALSLSPFALKSRLSSAGPAIRLGGVIAEFNLLLELAFSLSLRWRRVDELAAQVIAGLLQSSARCLPPRGRRSLRALRSASSSTQIRFLPRPGSLRNVVRHHLQWRVAAASGNWCLAFFDLLPHRISNWCFGLKSSRQELLFSPIGLGDLRTALRGWLQSFPAALEVELSTSAGNKGSACGATIGIVVLVQFRLLDQKPARWHRFFFLPHPFHFLLRQAHPASPFSSGPHVNESAGNVSMRLLPIWSTASRSQHPAEVWRCAVWSRLTPAMVHLLAHGSRRCPTLPLTQSNSRADVLINVYLSMFVRALACTSSHHRLSRTCSNACCISKSHLHESFHRNHAKERSSSKCTHKRNLKRHQTAQVETTPPREGARINSLMCL